MPIITECPTCDEPTLTSLNNSVLGAWIPHNCSNCGTTMVVEQTRMAGVTIDEDEFITDELPNLDTIERVDHPTEDSYIYADPERIQFRNVGGEE